jgi:transcriptional regulator with XRE-family HTH domain
MLCQLYEDTRMPNHFTATDTPRTLFARRLVKERTIRGLTQEHVAAHVIVSPQLYGHWENCRRIPDYDDARRLDMYYRLDEVFTWMHPLILQEAALPCGYVRYADEQPRACLIRAFDPLRIPSVAQDSEHARTLISRVNGPNLFILLTHQVVRTATRAELVHLIGLISQPNGSVQVIPDGAHKGGAFTLLGFPEGGDLAYFEEPDGDGRVIEIPDRVKRLRLLWEEIRSTAYPVHVSTAIIRRAMASKQHRSETSPRL